MVFSDKNQDWIRFVCFNEGKSPGDDVFLGSLNLIILCRMC